MSHHQDETLKILTILFTISKEYLLMNWFVNNTNITWSNILHSPNKHVCLWGGLHQSAQWMQCRRRQYANSNELCMLTSFLSRVAFTSSPLWATASNPWTVSTTNGCTPVMSLALTPWVEYLVWPTPKLPFSWLNLWSSNIWKHRTV